MADEKVYQGGNLTYWWIPAGGIADIDEPTAAEINAGLNISEAIAADGTEVGPSDSSDIDDRSIVDAGNAVEPGFDQYAATFTLFRPLDMSDLNDPYVIAYNLFKTQRVPGYIVKRRFEPYADVAVAGDRVSVFKVLSDHTANDTAGEDSVKLMVPFLPQGQMKANTFVKSANPVIALPATLAQGVGDKDVVVATLGASGPVITQGAAWSSSDTDVATVSPNGVVTAVGAGTATITAAHPSASTADTVAVTVS